MNVDSFLSRLEKVKRTGAGNWLACCPAHDDRSPSLNVREEPDGRILIHCFAECPPHEILTSVGMEFTDLFPEKLMEKGSPVRKPFPAADVLEALSTETLLVYIAADRMSKGEILDSAEGARLKLASQRIMAGRDMANGV